MADATRPELGDTDHFLFANTFEAEKASSRAVTLDERASQAEKLGDHDGAQRMRREAEEERAVAARHRQQAQQLAVKGTP